MHLDASLIIRDPYREMEIYEEIFLGDLVCLMAVKKKLSYGIL